MLENRYPGRRILRPKTQAALPAQNLRGLCPYLLPSLPLDSPRAPLLNLMTHSLPPLPQVSLQLQADKKHICFLAAVIPIPNTRWETQVMDQ